MAAEELVPSLVFHQRITKVKFALREVTGNCNFFLEEHPQSANKSNVSLCEKHPVIFRTCPLGVAPRLHSSICELVFTQDIVQNQS